MKAAAVGLGTIITVATALINFGIQLWNNDQPLVASIFFIVGGALYILGSYYGLSKAKTEALKEAKKYAKEYFDARFSVFEEHLKENK